MAFEKLEMLIDGKFTNGTSGKTQAVLNPVNEEVLGELPLASPKDLDAAIAAAQKGFKTWKAMTPQARQAIMNKAADLLVERTDAIAKNLTQEMGKPVGESKIELGFAIDVLRWYGEEGKRAYGRIVPSRFPGMTLNVIQEPVGPVAAFVAWNFPAVNVMRKVGGALGAGCSIIIKASEETPATCIAIARCFQEAGLPDGVLNCVFGVPSDVSEHLLADYATRKLSFTGSVPVGIHLQKLAADTMMRTTMELGGHSPVMVFDDADIEAAVKIIGGHKFRNAGQVCISPTRFYVQDKVKADFTDAFVDYAKSLKVGDGLEDGVGMGPLVADRRLDVMQGFVDDAVAKGADLLTGGERIGNQGYFYAPTVLDNVPDDARIMNEEPFGPLAPMTSFKDEADLLPRVNSLNFGLAAYAFTKDGARAKMLANEVNTGMLAINSPAVSTPETPFGGVDDSGYGSEGGMEGLQAYLRTKLVSEIGV